MQVWVVIVTVVLLGTQLYEWVVQATVPFWLYGVAGFVLAIASNQKPTPTISAIPEQHNVDSGEGQGPTPPVSQAQSISFTLNQKPD